jgi:putative zinc finger protein
VSTHERERLSAYLDDELDPAERAGVEAHLTACPECTAFLAELAAVDEAAAALPAEAPPGYFETFPARVRSRLQPRRARPRPREAPLSVRRFPAWTWAAAAALLLAVITPLTVRRALPPAPARALEPRPSGSEGMPAVIPEPPRKDLGAQAGAAEPKATPGPSAALPARPSGPAADRRADRLRPLPPLATAAAPRQKRDEAAEGRFAPQPGAQPPDELGPSRQQAPAETGSERAVGGGAVVSRDAANGETVENAPGRSGISAEKTSPMMSAASAGHDATPASLKAQEDALRRLEAVRPRTAAGWRSVREQWNALAAAEADPLRADEARVRAVIAAREAWRSSGDDSDGTVFRIVAESYLQRDDALQKPRVERLLVEAGVRRAP